MQSNSTGLSRLHDVDCEFLMVMSDFRVLQLNWQYVADN